jgi:hypothetical protein
VRIESSGYLLVGWYLYPSSSTTTQTTLLHPTYMQTYSLQFSYSFFFPNGTFICSAVCPRVRHSDSPADIKDKEVIILLKKHILDTLHSKLFPLANLAFGGSRWGGHLKNIVCVCVYAWNWSLENIYTFRILSYLRLLLQQKRIMILDLCMILLLNKRVYQHSQL